MKRFVAILFFTMTLNSILNAQKTGRQLKQIVISNQNPKIKIEVDSALSFIGSVSFNVDTIGVAEEYIFGEIKNGKLSRIFITHFEYFLPQNKLKFNYPRFRMATIGKQEYLHQIFFGKDFELFKIKELSELFKSKGLEVEADWMMNRYVRAVDTDKKHEMILFYLEPGSLVAEEIKAEAEKADPREKTTNKWQKALTERANAVFRVIEE